MEENAIEYKSASRLFVVVCALVLVAAAVVAPRVKLLTVHGDSMYPTLSDGQHAVAYRTDYAKLSQGDMVVVDLPEVSDHYIVKRVVGLQGDLVEIRDQTLYVNDELICKNLDGVYANVSVTVGTSQMYLLGDNQSDSFDSKYFGPVKSDSPIYVIGVKL